MSLNNQLLRDYIITHFLKEQISIEKNESFNKSEIDSFIEMPVLNKSVEPEKSIQQIITEKNFRYLENDILSKEFSLNREPEILELKKYSISLCFFNINENLNIPFLEFLFNNESGVFDFPRKELNMDVLADLYKKEKSHKINMENMNPIQDSNEGNQSITDDDDEYDEVEIEFFNQCSKFAQETVFLNDNILKQRYFGFIEKDDTLYVVFDVSNLDILENIYNNNNKSGLFLGIMDEIINRKKIFETPINEKIVELFVSSNLLQNIYDDNNEAVIIPKLLYLCIDEFEFEESDDEEEVIEQPRPETTEQQPKQQGGNNENQYKNAYYKSNETQTNSSLTSVINPKINHPLFDNTYLFTSEPLITSSQKGVLQELLSATTTNDEINKLKRFALQTESVKYYKDVDVKTLIEQNEQISPNYDAYCFYDDNREYWAVKSIASFTEL